MIERELGRGAMARVFLARDLKHGREVALKLLRTELLQEVGAERFLHEIRVTATLEHPHIVPLYDSGEADGLLFYTMPFVAGESLRARLDRDRLLPVDEAVAVTRTLAGALDYAHRKGVVHRDIKPENILIQDGQPLLADFGIALAISRTARDRLTDTGLSVGTPQYMSPEQATGERAVGPESDIYSLGAVAYEMLTGEPPITGPTAQAILARVVLEAPHAIRTVRATVSAAVEAAVLRALAKLPADRFRTAADFAAALGESALPVPETRLVRRAANRRTVLAAGATLAALALVAAVVVLARAPANPTPPQLLTQRQLSFTGNAQTPALSPDGQFLAYVAQVGDSQNVVVQDLAAGGNPETLYSCMWVASVEWSPDGTKVLVGCFFNVAVILPRQGGAPQYLDFPRFSFAHWMPDGAHVSLHEIGGDRVLIVDLRTRDTVAVRLPAGEGLGWQGSWSPDGRLFATASLVAGRSSIRTMTLEGEQRLVVDDSVPLGSPRWVDDGKTILYTRGLEAIWRVGVSPRTGERTEAPEMVRAGLEALPVNFGALVFSTTRDGRMAYGRGSRYSNIWLVETGTTRQQPRISAMTRGTALRWSPVVSPDGGTIAFAQETNGAGELWRMPIDGETTTQITVGAQVSPHSQIAWAPDGTRLAFETVRAGRGQVWTAAVSDGRFRRYAHTSMSTLYSILDWAPGIRIAYLSLSHHDVQLLDPSSGTESVITGDTAMYLLPQQPRRDTPAARQSYIISFQYSPDGNRLAVHWLKEPRREIGVFDLRNSSYTKLADDPGWVRGWSSDGRFVYVQHSTSGRTIFRIDTRRRATPQPIIDLPFRESQCAPAGKLRPNAFVCTAFDFNSDIWMIENFDSNIR